MTSTSTEPKPAYDYLDGSMESIDVTNEYFDDEEAFEGIYWVEREHPGQKVQFIKKREPEGSEYKFLPVRIENGKVVHDGRGEASAP